MPTPWGLNSAADGHVLVVDTAANGGMKAENRTAAAVPDAAAITASGVDPGAAKLTDVQALRATVNDLLAKLRTAKVLA